MNRPHLRVGLAVIAAADTIAAARQVASTLPGPHSHPLAPSLLLALGGQSLVVGLLAAIGLASLLVFARGRASLRAGGLALLVLTLLVETHAALVHGPSRPYFFCGALLLAWLGGVGFARALRRPDPERFAEAAAIGTLAAIYVSAGLSKLLHSGLSWADQRTLRAIVLAHHRISDASLAGAYARCIASRPWLAQAMATLTLVVQLGAVLYLVGPRLRALWGALLLGFHVHVTIFTGIGYLEAKLLVALFSYPWPAWLARLRGRPREPEDDPHIDRAGRALGLAALLLALIAALAWLSPIRGYTDLHHAERGRARTG